MPPQNTSSSGFISGLLGGTYNQPSEPFRAPEPSGSAQYRYVYLESSPRAKTARTLGRKSPTLARETRDYAAATGVSEQTARRRVREARRRGQVYRFVSPEQASREQLEASYKYWQRVGFSWQFDSYGRINIHPNDLALQSTYNLMQMAYDWAEKFESYLQAMAGQESAYYNAADVSGGNYGQAGEYAKAVSRFDWFVLIDSIERMDDQSLVNLLTQGYEAFRKFVSDNGKAARALNIKGTIPMGAYHGVK